MQAVTEPGWRYWLLIVLLTVGGVCAFGAALIALLAGALFLTRLVEMPSNSAVFFFNLAWSSALVGALVTRALFAVMRPRPAVRASGGLKKISAALLLWAVVALLFQSVEQSALAWLLLPPLVVAGSVAPVWGLLELARQRLDPLPDSRAWGIPALSLVVTIPVTLLVSLFGLVVYFIGMALYLNSRPELTLRLNLLMERMNQGQFDPALLSRLSDLLFGDPVVVALLISLIAGLTPLVEELLKPLALWLFAGDRLTPAQGFLGGVLCGAAFGLWENINALSSAGDGGGTLILVLRVGSVLLHMTTTGMVGWGMASFWQDRRHLVRLAGGYLLAVGLHAAWNLFAILSAAPALPQLPLRLAVESGSPNRLAWLALALLALFNLFLLSFMNARLRPRAATGAFDSPPPPASASSLPDDEVSSPAQERLHGMDQTGS